MHVISPKISNRQRNIIMGTILGGSSVVKPQRSKNCYLAMRCKDLEWLKFKATALENLSSAKILEDGKTNRWRSLSYPIFNECREMFWTGRNREIKPEVLDQLKDLSLAVWFVDVGRCKDRKIELNTNIWGLEGTRKIQDYFKSLDWVARISRYKQDRYRLELDEEASRNFTRLIAPVLPIGYIPNPGRSL